MFDIHATATDEQMGKQTAVRRTEHTRNQFDSYNRNSFSSSLIQTTEPVSHQARKKNSKSTNGLYKGRRLFHLRPRRIRMKKRDNDEKASFPSYALLVFLYDAISSYYSRPLLLLHII